MTQTPQCSTQMVQIIRDAAHVVLASEELTAIASAARVDQGEQIWGAKAMSAISAALENRYGLLGARGTALQVGRAAFKDVAHTFGHEDGFEDEEYRLLPVRKRARAGLEKLAAIFDCACGIRVAVTAEPDAWLWTLADCEDCQDPRVESAVAHFMLGLLQEYFAYISGGKVFLAEETACRADGDPACEIRIQRMPLD